MTVIVSRFKLLYKISLMEDSLKTEFTVLNTGTSSTPIVRFFLKKSTPAMNTMISNFPTLHSPPGSESIAFTCLLHTYFRVPDVTKVTVSGFKGLTYIDKVTERTLIL